jgi:hypothetical protein
VLSGAKDISVFELNKAESQPRISLPASLVRAVFASIIYPMNPAPGDRQEGQSMIEFAFTLVILIIILMGVIDLGRAIFTYLALRDAAQEGASYASYNPFDTTGILNRVCGSSNTVTDLCAGPDLDIQVNAAPPNGVRVRVLLNNFTLVTPFLGAVVGTQTISISASVTDTILVSQPYP